MPTKNTFLIRNMHLKRVQLYIYIYIYKREEIQTISPKQKHFQETSRLLKHEQTNHYSKIKTKQQPKKKKKKTSPRLKGH